MTAGWLPYQCEYVTVYASSQLRIGPRVRFFQKCCKIATLLQPVLPFFDPHPGCSQQPIWQSLPLDWYWRPRPESNWCTRICNPMDNHSPTRPSRRTRFFIRAASYRRHCNALQRLLSCEAEAFTYCIAVYRTTNRLGASAGVGYSSMTVAFCNGMAQVNWQDWPVEYQELA